MAEVREAVTDDLKALLRLGEAMHAESNFSAMTFDARHYGEFLVNLMAHSAHAALVAEEDGQLVGVVLCGCAESFFGPDRQAYEFLWYVSPEYRRTGAGVALLKAFRDWAWDQGAVRVQAGNSAGMPDEIYTRVLADVGFQRAGSLMYLEP